MYKRFAPVLWLCAASLFAQNGQHPDMHMPEMQMEKPSAPVPELLEGVASRPPLKLEDFLDLADKNNPTLQQAAAIIRRSEAAGKTGRALPQSLGRL